MAKVMAGPYYWFEERMRVPRRPIHLSSAPIEGYRRKIKSLSRRIPKRNKHARKIVLQRIRRAKAGLAKARQVYKLSRAERIPIKAARRIVSSYKLVKRQRQRLRLRQGRQFVREVIVRRPAGPTLKSSYYDYDTGDSNAFGDILRTERGRNAARVDDVIHDSAGPAGYVLRLRIKTSTGETWVASPIMAVETPIDQTYRGLIDRLPETTTDGITTVFADDDMDAFTITGGSIQLIYAG